MIATMRRLGRPLRVTADGRLLTLTVDLCPPSEPAEQVEPAGAEDGARQATKR
jgi:hypothetical protein